jgi:hypothetical protein
MAVEITNKDVCIIIPIYKDNIDTPLLYDEVESIYHTLKLMNKYDIYFLCHPDLNISFYKRFECNNIHFATFNYKNREEYSNMCLNYTFYNMFSNYKYMLICQTDAYIFRDELLYWCNKGYDYIGALGLFKRIYPKLLGNWGDKNVGDIHDYKFIVMNGGFSLRNIKSMYELCFKYKDELKNETFNEDCILFWYYKDELKLPPLEEAIKFSAENQTYAFYPKYYNQLPFGCHTRKTKYKLFDIFGIK